MTVADPVEPKYGELRSFTDAEGRTRHCSPAVNPEATTLGMQIDTEGRVWMMPYLMAEDSPLHCDPPMICVGRQVQAGFGVDPEPGVQDVLESLQLPSGILKQIRDYLLKHPPILW